MKERVLLGMSGGVDSSVSAILLKQQGYEVVGATMRLWEDEKDANTSVEKELLTSSVENTMKESVIKDKKVEQDSVVDAKKVCAKLGIEHHVIDLREEFKNRVINNFICTYLCAKTPNPCVECNKYMKFDAFYKIAQKLNCKYIATGHYAKVCYSEKYGQYVLKKSEEEGKDQTYFLYGINKEILPYVIFPLSDFTNKDEIREIALENNLEVAKKKDSQEVCFIPNNDYADFVQKANKVKPKQSGNIVLENGETLGKHNGLIHYTIGQRKGLGIAYKEPLYVLKLDADKNQVVVGPEEKLYTSELIANELNFLVDIDLTNKIAVKAKVRYRAKEEDAILEVQGEIAKVTFTKPQRAITPGQSVVFYIEDGIVLGGGKIIDTVHSLL